MPFTPIADTAKVEILLYHTVTLQPIVNVLHASCLSPPSSTQVEDIASAVDSAVGANLHCWGSQVQYTGTRCTGLTSATDPQALETTGAGTGTGGNNAAAGLCALVKMTTDVRSRSTRGRVFIGPPAGSDLIDDGTQWDPAYLSELVTMLEAMVTNLGALTPASELVIASRKLGTSRPVGGFITEAAPAYQRRRGAR